MATWNDLIKNSLRLLKVKEAGETLDASEATDGLEALNNLLDSWSNERWMQTYIQELTVSLTAGDGEYSIGNTGSFQEPEALVCGSLDLEYHNASKWATISDGQFKINFGGTGIKNAECDFSSDTTMDAVASTMAASIKNFAGTITTTVGSPQVDGSGTDFVNEIAEGDILTWTDDAGVAKTGTVFSRTNSIIITLTENADSVATGVTYSKSTLADITCAYDEPNRRFKFYKDGDSITVSYLTGGAGGTNIASILKGLVNQAENNTDTNIWPVKIQSAFIRDSSNNDYPIYPMTQDQYARVGDKTTQSGIPNYYYYERSYPYGKIHLVDVPSSAYTLHLRVWPQWTQARSGSYTVDLPPGYKRALVYNLALEIAPEYVDNVSPLIAQTAITSKNWIKTVNTEVPIMRSPARFVTGNRFDVNTGDCF